MTPSTARCGAIGRDRCGRRSCLPDASFEQVSVLEEHRIRIPEPDHPVRRPSGTIRTAPSVASFVGYTGEITEAELTSAEVSRATSPARQIGKAGLEKQYEAHSPRAGRLAIRRSRRAGPRRARGGRAAGPASAAGAQPLNTNIDIDLQRFTATRVRRFAAGTARSPCRSEDGEVLAMHSAPSFDPNRFTGGIPADYWNQLRNDPRRPLFNKAMQGRIHPARRSSSRRPSWRSRQGSSR